MMEKSEFIATFNEVEEVAELLSLLIGYKNLKGKSNRLAQDAIYAVSRNIHEKFVSRDSIKKGATIVIVGKYKEQNFTIELNPKYGLGASFKKISSIEAMILETLGKEKKN